jgi:hypothetical protein
MSIRASVYRTMLVDITAVAIVSLIGATIAAQGQTDGQPATHPVTELLRPSDSPETRPAPTYDPTDAYELQNIEGWNVRVNKHLSIEKPELAAKTLKLLDMHLYQITRVVPAPAVAKLQKVTIWVELHDRLVPCMCYHPDLGWVMENGLNPAKVKCVELGNPKNFLTWTVHQPWMVLHELSHAYHDQYLPEGYNNPEIAKTYQNAKDHDLYKCILRNSGRSETAYAMNNAMEYYAETSEAFFGVNDFFPFNRAELKLHDPQGYEMMVKEWGVERETVLLPPSTQPAADQTWVR